MAPHGILAYQCITHTHHDSACATNSISVCHHEANSTQCRPCVNSCDMNPSFFSFFLFSSSLLRPTPPLPGGRVGGSKDGERVVKGGTEGQAHAGQDSFISLHGGLDARSMYEKLTMLNLQSGSNWSGPNNWYHDPTGVQTQHSTGEWTFPARQRSHLYEPKSRH